MVAIDRRFGFSFFICIASSIIWLSIKHHLHANRQLIDCNLFESMHRRNEKQMFTCSSLRRTQRVENRSESLTNYDDTKNDSFSGRLDSMHRIIIRGLRATRNVYELMLCHFAYHVIRYYTFAFRCRHVDASTAPPSGKLLRAILSA